MAQALQLPHRLWRKLLQTAEDVGKEPEELAVEMLKESLAQLKKDAGKYLDWDEALAIGNEHGRSWSDQTAGRRWINRWNERHPQGDPFHIERAWGQISRAGLIKALEESKR